MNSRYGENDELGFLNRLTDDIVLEAAKEIKSGVRYVCVVLGAKLASLFPMILAISQELSVRVRIRCLTEHLFAAESL